MWLPICSRSRLSVQLALIILSIQILVITILPITSQINLADDQLSWAGSIYSADLLKKLDPRLFNATYISWLASIANLSASEMLSLGYIVKIKPQNLGECYRELEYVLPPLSLKIFHIFRETRLLALKMDRIANSSEVLKAALKLAGIDCVEKIWVDNPRKIAIFDVNPLMGIIEARENNRVNGSGIRIAILDTGINTRNPDLLGSVIYWRDFINGRTEPYDDNGHGTMISGIIASRGLTKIGNGNRIWHSVNHDRSDEFNYAGPANLTYAVNVTQFRGLRLNISYIHAYWIERSGDYGAVMVRFDTVSSWVTLATYRGTMLITTPASHVVEIPANATVMYVSFIYSTDTTSQLGGWWVDDIKIQDLFDTAKIILYDDVEGPPPRELISSYLWVRAPSRVEGIAPGSQLMAAKVCTSEGLCPDVAIMLGIEWAVLGSDGVPGTGDEAHIISLSFTAPAISYDPIMEMVDWAYSNGVTVVVSAGNSGPGYETLESPGAARGAISVGASTKVNTIASFSSWGPSPVDYSLKPELVAYGVYIITTLASDQNPPLAIASGTSLSAPIVSGLAALLKQAHPYWGPEEIRSSLISKASTHITPSRIINYTMNHFI
jgi:subtilisin family serine protease